MCKFDQYKSCLCKALPCFIIFAISIAALAIVIKIIAGVLTIFGGSHLDNIIIVIVAVFIVSMFALRFLTMRSSCDSNGCTVDAESSKEKSQAKPKGKPKTKSKKTSEKKAG